LIKAAISTCNLVLDISKYRIFACPQVIFIAGISIYRSLQNRKKAIFALSLRQLYISGTVLTQSIGSERWRILRRPLFAPCLF
jgi:hypothetical protein